MLFSELYKIMVNKVTFAGFRGAIAPLWIRPCLNHRHLTDTDLQYIWCLLLCNNFNESLTYLPFFSLKYFEAVISYFILSEVARKLSCFCKMARRSKVVGHAGIDDAQSFLGYVLSSKLFFRIRFSSALRAHSVTEGIMIIRRQL